MSAFFGKDRIAGNQNWLAATLISTLPFVIILLSKLPKKYFISLVAIVVLPTLYVLIDTSARALVPAVGAFIFYYCLQRKSLKFNTAVFGSIFVLCLIVIFVKNDKFQRVVQQDIRGALSKDTLSLIASNSFLGTGPEIFKRTFRSMPPMLSRKRSIIPQ